MPAQSQQQQKLFGLALAFKRGEVKSSEVSDEIKGIADRMSEKEIEDFAATKRKGLPKMKEQLRKIVREIMREKAISEMNEVAGKEAMGIAALTGTRGSAVEDFINKHELDGKKLFRSIKKANLRGRLNFVSALAGKDGNPNQKLTIKLHKENESVNEGYSTEEKRIVMMAIKKLAKYRNVPIDQSVNDLLGAGAELQRDIKKGKIKK
jgi:hypothetical protein|tara:strand:+ start:296 stop:919 length:624 start_codon:yes stop_codon:yes gene_type:complete